MRKLRPIMLLMTIIALTACTNSNTPLAIAEKFNKALYKADFEGAKLLCTEESKQDIDFIAVFASEKVDEMKLADIRYKSKSVKMSLDGNSADIEGLLMGVVNDNSDLLKSDVPDTTSTKIHLVKQQEKWLVAFKLP